MVILMEKSVLSLFLLSVLALSTIFGTLAISSEVSAGGSGVDYFATIYARNASNTFFDQEVWVTIVNSGTIRHIQITNYAEISKDPLGSVAIAPNGNVFAVYNIYTGGYSEDIHYAILTPHGGFVKTDALLAGNGTAPCVAVTPNGAAFAVWMDREVASFDIKYSIMDMDGVVMVTNSLDRPDTAYFPTVAASILVQSNNNVVMAWEEEMENDGNQEEIWFMILDSQGNTIKVPTKVTDTGSDSRDVNAAIMGNGNFVLVWTEYSFASSDTWVYYAVYDSNGNVVLASTNLTDSGESREPAVAAMLDSAIVVWEEGSEDPQDVYYATIDGQGNVMKSPAPVTTYADDDDDADVAVDQKGNLVVVWEQTVYNDPSFGQVDRGAYALLDTSGNIITTDVLLTNIDTSYIGTNGRRFVAAAIPPTVPVGGTLLPITDLAIFSPLLLIAFIVLAVGATILYMRRRLP